MLSLITPENLPGVLTAIGALLAAVGGLTLRRARREPPKPGTPDAAAQALAENTRALIALSEQVGAQNRHFGDNNRMFGEIMKLIGEIHRLISEIARDTEETRQTMTAAREHLAALREQGNRRAR